MSTEHTSFETVDWAVIARRAMKAMAHFRHARSEFASMIEDGDGHNGTLPHGEQPDGSMLGDDGRDRVTEKRLMAALRDAESFATELNDLFQIYADEQSVRNGSGLGRYLDPIERA